MTRVLYDLPPLLNVAPGAVATVDVPRLDTFCDGFLLSGDDLDCVSRVRLQTNGVTLFEFTDSIDEETGELVPCRRMIGAHESYAGRETRPDLIKITTSPSGLMLFALRQCTLFVHLRPNVDPKRIRAHLYVAG